MAMFSEIIPTGTVDGTNTLFTVVGAPTSVEVYRNGVLQGTGDCTVTQIGTSSAEIAFGVPPGSGDILDSWVYTQ